MQILALTFALELVLISWLFFSKLREDLVGQQRVCRFQKIIYQ